MIFRTASVSRAFGRTTLFAAALACCPVTTLLRAGITLQPVATSVGRYERLEFLVTGLPEYTRPFDPNEVDLHLEVVGPDGRQFLVPAFQMQEYERRRLPAGNGVRDWTYPVGLPIWKARFAPQAIGSHHATAVLVDRTGANRSADVAFDCVPSGSKGFVRVSRSDPRFLEFSNGEPFFAIGQNLAFIGSQQYVTLSRAEVIFTRLGENGANYLRIWTCCDDWALALEARKSAWGRSWAGRSTFVPLPGDEERKGISFSSTNTVRQVEPSHPVALRPGTRYVLSARLRTTTGAALQLEIQGSTPEKPWASTPPPAWSEFHHPFTTGTNEYWLAPTRFRLEGTGSAWLSDVSLKEADGSPELLWEAEMNRPVRGFYNPLDSFLLDELVSAAERSGIRLQLCLLTRDLYMSALKDPASPGYAQAIADAKNLLRYAVARWGASTSVAAWEYWNELDPGLPTDRFYAELGSFLQTIDPYAHLRTTSTWGPSARDCRHPQLDLADVHFYLRPADKGRLSNEVDAVLERTRWLREQAPSRPVHLGEFGLADDQWRITDEMQRSRELVDAHNALWASALSGASGTALFWWWERLDERDVYPFYGSLSRFLADVPWNSGQVQPLSAKCSDERCRVIGLRAGDRAWLWIFDPAAAWSQVVTAQRTPPERRDLSLELDGIRAPNARVMWWDTRAGKPLSERAVGNTDAALRLAVPTFRRDVACRLVW